MIRTPKTLQEIYTLLNFNFVMIYIKSQYITENHLNHIKDSIFKCFLKEYNRLLIFKKIN